MKVIIVDDEILVRAGMQMMIPWEELGFDVVREASSAEEGIRVAREIHPDLMLVDITMPGENGLEMVRQLKEEIENCHFIILSCHSEVEYLTAAIRIGVTDYILKDSLNPEEITLTLKKIADSFQRDGKDKVEKTARLEELFLKAEQDQKCLCRDFVKMIQGPSSTQNAYFVFLIQVKKFSHLSVAEKICEQIIKEYEIFSVHYCTENSAVFFGVVRRDFHPQELIGHRCVETLSHNFSVESSAAASECRYGDEPVRTLLSQAYQAADMKWIRGWENVAVYSALQKEKNKTELENIRSSCLPIQDIYGIDKAQVYLEKLHEYIKRVSFIKRSTVLHQFSDLAFQLNEELRKAGMQEDLFTIEEMPMGEPGQESYDRLYEIYRDKMSALAENMKQRIIHPTIVQIKGYIKNHLSERIFLEDIASEVHLSRTYISSLFKKETGMNINDYITGQKLDYAKKLLLSGVSISDIVEKTGIQSESYFAKLFREKFNSSPSQYVKEYKLKYFDKNS